MQDIIIGKRKIGPRHKPFIIAEMSGNHNQSLERALEIVNAAAACGVDAMKLQTYTADTMTLDLNEREFFIDDPKSLWKGQSLYDLYKKAYTPWEWHKPIFDRCKELGVICFSTPFDATSVDFLESIDAPLYKIASFENKDLPLIKKVAATGKPIIASTGMTTVADLEDLVRTVRGVGNNQLVLLKCTSSYPSSPEFSNLATIPHMSELFDLQVGLSDHTMGIGVSLASIALGATVIEKHFTLARADGGVDSAFSMEPAEMKALVVESERAWQSIGQISYQPTESENKSMRDRRSIYIVEDLPQGAVLTEKNIRLIRPGLGLEPKFFDIVLGKRINKSAKRGTPVSWEILG